MQSNSSPDDMQNRIDRLEGLVLSLMTNGSQAAGPTAANRALSMDSGSGSMQYPQDVDIDATENNMPLRGEGSEESETDQVVQSLGVMRVENNKSMYIGDAHWAAILSDVRFLFRRLRGRVLRCLDCRSQELLCRAQASEAV